MAYVGTPTRYGDPVRSLASVLQGEASSRAGQIAVANVITNRASVNFSGYGSGILDQAFARNQFQGQSAPSAQAIQIAQQTLDGSLPRTLTNSLNYAAPVFTGPGATTAGWAKRALASGEGVNIGGNVFFVDSKGGTPNYMPGASGAPLNTNDPIGNYSMGGGGNYYYDPLTGTRTPTTDSYAIGSGEGDLPLIDSEKGILYGNGQIGAGSFAGNNNVAGGLGATEPGKFGISGFPGASNPLGNGNQATGANSAGSSSQSAAGGGGTAGGSMTVPQAIDAQTRGNASDTKALNQQSKQNTDSLTKTATENTDKGIKAANELYNRTAGSWSDYFARIIFVIVGIICLVGAVMLFSKPKQLIQNVAKAAL